MATTAQYLQYARTEHASRLASAREATAKGEHNGDWVE